MKEAPIGLFLFFALFFCEKPATAQPVPESCVLTERSTGKTDTLHPGIKLRVEVVTGDRTSTFIRPLIFWHADTLALGPLWDRPQVFLPVGSIQSVKWQLPDKPDALQRRRAGRVLGAAGGVLWLTGASIFIKHNPLLPYESTSQRGVFIASLGGMVTLTGAVVKISGRRRSRTAKDPATGWLVTPLGQGR